jgi:hypothetical protein
MMNTLAIYPKVLKQLEMGLPEERYADLKDHGFDLEATRLTDALRISRLMLAIAITYGWLISLGSCPKRGVRQLLDAKSRRDKSYFRIGWDWLQRALSLQLPIRTFPPILKLICG